MTDIMGIFNRRSNDNPDDTAAENTPQISAPNETRTVGFETVLGASSHLEGDFSSEGNVRLDGTFKGNLDITGNVLVGETAEIHADIDAQNISIAGAVRGNVSGNKVQLLRTGRIWGDIRANALTTEEGAFIEGNINMQSHAANQSAAKTEAADHDTADESDADAAPDATADDES